MRRLLAPLVLASSLSLSGCYINLITPTPNLTVPLTATTSLKEGTATCTEIFWAFIFGDCSMSAALKDGNISRVHHVDAKTKILFYGFYSELTIIANGE